MGTRARALAEIAARREAKRAERAEAKRAHDATRPDPAESAREKVEQLLRRRGLFGRLHQQILIGRNP